MPQALMNLSRKRHRLRVVIPAYPAFNIYSRIALVSYDQTLRKVFLANHDPAGWGGLAATPWFLAREASGTSAMP